MEAAAVGKGKARFKISQVLRSIPVSCDWVYNDMISQPLCYLAIHYTLTTCSLSSKPC